MIPQWAFKHAQYYIDIAEVVKSRKRCYSRQIGAVLVKNDSIISTGINGPPRGIPMCDEWRGNWADKVDGKLGHTASMKEVGNQCPRRVLEIPSGQGLEYCSAAHAERNAILMCAKNGISTDKGILFLTCGVPCKDCMIEIIQAGIQAIFCANDEIYDSLSYELAHEAQLPIYYINDGVYKLVDKKFIKMEL
jgi:dCMP deaminase